MSPRAAWRLESIGFTRVYDYVAGKADWGSFGLPLEGTKGVRAGEHVRADVPTCGVEERLQDVRRKVSGAGWDTCIVVNEQGVVLGRLGRKALAMEEDVAVEAVMTAGPSPVRPSIQLVALGFLGFFALVGLPVSFGVGAIARAVPWAGLATGALLAIVGLVTLFGIHVRLPVHPRLRVRRERRMRAMLLFGVGYGAASL